MKSLPKKIMLLLGAGVSRQSGLPDTDCLTEQILQNDWHGKTGESISPGKPPRGFSSCDGVPKWQEFLRRLKIYADNFYAKYPLLETKGLHKTNYEDLYYLTSFCQFHGALRLKLDPAAKPFFDVIADSTRDIWGTRSNDDLPALSSFAGQVLEFIKAVVANELEWNGDVSGLDLVKELAELASNKQIDSLDLATLNHDCLLEKCLGELEKDYTDGFASTNEAFTPFCPDTYETHKAPIRLLKVHGSIGWHYFRDQVRERRELGIPDSEPGSLNLYTDCDRTEWTMSKTPAIVVGTGNKAKEYFQNPETTSLIHWLYRFTLQHQVIVTSGCSFGDDEVRNIIGGWLDSESNRCLLALLEERDVEHSPGLKRLREKFDEKRVFVTGKRLSCTSLDEIRNILSQ